MFFVFLSESGCQSLLKRVKCLRRRVLVIFVYVKKFLLEPLAGKPICDYGLYLEIADG